jgi:uncharacterized protein YdaU (DUF1376 family)
LSEKKSARRRIEDGRVIYFMWCPADFNAKTTHLTDEARSAYRELIDFAFLHGRFQTDLPDDDRYLMMAAKAKPRHWPTIRYLLFECPKPMFVRTDDGGFWRNTRLAEEVEIALEKSGQAAAAVAAREAQRSASDRPIIGRSSGDDHPFSGRSSSKKENKKKKPTKTLSSPVLEREATSAGARARAIEARGRDVAAWLKDNPGVLQCLHCLPHAPHAPNRCAESLRTNERCDCAEEGATRLSAAAAVAFKHHFQFTWEEWCEMRHAAAGVLREAV